MVNSCKASSGKTPCTDDGHFALSPEGKIKDLFPSGSLSSSTILVLVNTVYFKGQWNHKFDEKHNREEKFWMNKLEEQLTADKLLQWTNPENMHKIELDLSLPQFKVEEKYDLPGPLKHMGMVNAFNPQKADFSGMSETQGLVVSKVLHKSFVEVNEEGTEAAAAARVKSSLLSAPIPKDFYCNHPFQFIMKQNKTNSILFFGRMYSP